MQIQGLSSLSSAQLSSAFVGLDFTRNQYKSAFVQTNSFASLPGVTFSRSGAAYAEDLNGNLISFASGAPRITNKGLLIEEGRTNLATNNTMAGAATGTPGTLPTGWATGADAQLGTITRTIVGTGTSAYGWPYMDVRYQFTASSGGRVYLRASNAISVAASTSYTFTYWITHLAGTSNVYHVPNVTYYNSVPAADNDSYGSTILLVPNYRQKFDYTSSSTGTSVTCDPRISFNISSAGSYDFTVRLEIGNFEAGSCSTSPIQTSGTSASRNPDICFMQMPAAIAPYTAYQSIVWNRKSAFATVAIYFEGQNNPGAQGLSFSSQPGGYYPRILNRHGTIRGETGGARASECRDGSEVKMAAASDGSITYASINGQTQPFNNIPGQQDWTNTFNIGHRSNNGAGPQFYANTYIKNIYIFDKAVSQERLNAATQIGSTAGLSFDFANQTFRNAAGYVRANLLTQSNVFTHANWVTNNSPTIALSGTAPNGANAYLFTRTTTAATWVQQATPKPASASQYVFSINVKAGTGRYFALRLQGTYPARVDVVFDLQTGTLYSGPTTANGFANVAWTISPSSNGWYRVSVSATTDAVVLITPLFSFNSAGVVVDGTDVVATSSGYISQAQLEVGAYPTSYINTVTTADSTTTYASANIADIAGLTFTRNSISYAEDNGGNLVQFGYHVPRITNKGLLIEETRTNLALDSSMGSNWGKNVNDVITPNSIVAPDGTTTGTKVQVTSGPNNIIYRQFNVTAGTTYTASLYMRQGSGGIYQAILLFGASGAYRVWLNTTNGTLSGNLLTGVWTGGSATVSQAGNGWWRVSLTVTVVTDTAVTLETDQATSSGIYGTNAGDFFYCWGAQLEAGSFATSYIPTTSAAATRPAEICFVSGLNVAAGAYFSLAAQADTSLGIGDQRFVELGTGSDRMILRRPASTSGTVYVGSGGSGTEIEVGVVAAGGRQTIVGTYASGSVGFLGMSNGGSLRTNGSAAIPSAMGTLGLGVNSGGAGPVNGYMRFINLYYNELLDYEMARLVDAGNYFNLDFVANRYRNNTGVSSTSPSALGTFTVSRNSIGYVEDRDGNLTQVAANTARISNRGILVEESRTNLLLRSQALGTSPWGNNNAPTVTNNYATAPDGTLTATRIVSGGGLSGVNQGGINIPSITPYSFSGWLRDNGGTKKQVVLALSQNWFGGTGGDRSVWVDLATAKETGRHADLNAAIVNVTMKNNGWIYFEIVFTPTSTTANGAVVVYANTASTDFLAWGMQLEVGTLATSYIPTTTAAATRPNEDVSVVTPANAVNPFNNNYTLYMQAVHGTKSTTVTHRLGGPGMTGADNLNRLGFVVNTGGASIVALYNAGASVSNTIASPKFAKGHVVKLGIRRSGTGYSTSLSGIYDTGNNLTSAAPTFQCIWIGKDPGSNTVYWNGYVEKVALIPYAVSDHDFRALTRNADTTALNLDFVQQKYTAPAGYVRANMIRNSTFAGGTTGVIGSGGVFSGLSISTPMTGITSTITGFGTEFSMPYVEIRFNGTPNISSYFNMSFETAVTEAANGQTWTVSYYDRLVAGTTNGVSQYTPQINENTSTNVYVTGGVGTSYVPTSALTRRWYTRTLSGGGTVSSVQPIFTWAGTAGQAIDFTMRFYAPQLEKARYPSTFIPTTLGGLVSTVTTTASNLADIGNFSFSRNSVAYADDGAGNLIQFAANVPRITSKGLMIEPARTNSFRSSQEFNDPAWGKIAVTVTGNVAAAPDGTLTADLCAATSTSHSRIEQTPVSGWITNTAYAISVYATAGTCSPARFGFYTGPADTWISFDLAKGMYEGTTGTLLQNPSITPLAGGWYRIGCVLTTPATNLGFSGLKFEWGDNIISNGSQTSGTSVYLWGAQLETGTDVQNSSSYIPTTSAAVTRAADVALYDIPVTIANCSLAGEGRITQNYGSGLNYSGRIAALVGTINDDLITISLSNGSQAQVSGAGYSVSSVQPTTTSQHGMLIPVAVYYDGTNFKGAGMGAAATTVAGTYSGVSAASFLKLGDNSGLTGGSRVITGYVTKVALYSYGFGDSELQYRGAGNLT